MPITKSDVERYFSVGNVVNTGGKKTSFKIEKIDKTIRIKPTQGKNTRSLRYNELSLVIDNFEHCEPGEMISFVTGVLNDNNVDRSNVGRCYLYGMAREYLKRKQQNTLSTFEEINHKFENAVEEAKKSSCEERKARLEKASRKPTSSASTITVFNRNPDVVAEVLERANGVCEACGNDAPFKRTKDGTPFLEVHHKKRLADDGDDTVENAIALCPNCHRKQHYGITK
jgi:5-methylcytosine-specific restriction protein A